MTLEEMLAVWSGAAQAVDADDPDAFRAKVDPEVSLVTVADWPDGGTYRGAEAVWGFVRDFVSVFSTGAFEVLDPAAARPDTLVLTLRRMTAGDQSGAEVEFSLGVVVTFCNQRLLSMRYFRTRDEALAAAQA